VEEIARVYSNALFGVAKEAGKLDEIHSQLGEIADAIAEERDLQVFFFSPYFSSQEKRKGIEQAITGAEDELINFLELLAEKHRMPAIFRIRDRFDDLYAEENKRLEVKLTSAIELDPKVVKKVGDEVERQTSKGIDMNTEVDEEILGGIVLQVGNRVLDASVRGRLEKLRKEVAQAA